jgi:uncharacterized membrane protein
MNETLGSSPQTKHPTEMDYGSKIFDMLKWEVAPSKMTFAYGLLFVWIVAVVFLILQWINASKPGITEDQKKYNTFSSITLLALIICIYLTTAIGA